MISKAKALIKSAGLATACEWVISEGLASSMAEAELVLERALAQ
jgi:hypothetical protein